MSGHERDELTQAELDGHYAGATAAATGAERAAARIYQGRDRRYKIVNDVLRRKKQQSELRESDQELVGFVVEHLASLVVREGVPRECVVYRGVRNFEATFKVAVRDAEALVGTARQHFGFFSATIHERVAREEFVDGANGALLRVRVRPGAAAAWIPPLGLASEARQGELIFPNGTRILVTAVRREGGHLLVDCDIEGGAIQRRSGLQAP